MLYNRYGPNTKSFLFLMRAHAHPWMSDGPADSVEKDNNNWPLYWFANVPHVKTEDVSTREVCIIRGVMSLVCRNRNEQTVRLALEHN